MSDTDTHNLSNVSIEHDRILHPYIYDNSNPLESRTLLEPLDSLPMQDPRVMHGVTPVAPKHAEGMSVRDVVVIDYFCRAELKRPE